MTDVFTLGELLIDMVQTGPEGFQAKPGGAPANVLAMLKKLGRTVYLQAKVGTDGFGTKLIDTLRQERIPVAGICRHAMIPTTLAIVQKDESGDRTFSFYRQPGADIMLHKEEIDWDVLKNSRIFHFGTLSMTDEPCKSATKEAVRIAKENGILVSCDPNLRENLWRSAKDAKQAMEYALSQCDILKISDNEIEFLTGMADVVEGMRVLLRRYPNIRVAAATCGARGSVLFANGHQVEEKGYVVDTIETTGAGDTFCACLLDLVLKYGVDHLHPDAMRSGLRFANAAAALVTTHQGALTAMPSVQEVEALLLQQEKKCRMTGE